MTIKINNIKKWLKYLEREAALIKYVGVNITHTVDMEILKGPGAKADMRKGFLINDGNREYF